MIRIASAQLWVHDQDAALDFWTGKVGLEVRQDVTMPEMGGFRWLTVGPPGQDDVSIVLMAIPGPPMIDGTTQTEIADLTAKGFAGTIFLTTDNCQAPTRICRHAASNSPRHRSRGRTASMRASVIRRATACG